MAKLGRPLAMSADDRRKEIFNVAEKLFGEYGFEQVSMSQIATAAAMSKKTLYVYFADKKQLLQSLVASSYIWSDDVDAVQMADPVLALQQLLKHIVQHVLSERHIKLCRLAIAEHINIEGSTQTFYEMGILNSRNHLVGALQRIPTREYRLQFDAEHMADILFGAIIAKPFIDALIIGQAANFSHIEQVLEKTMQQFFVST